MEPRKLSAFFPHIWIDANLDVAWEKMIDYRSWNPNYARSELVTVAGEPGAEGEVVLTKIFDVEGRVLAEYYAETVRIIPRQHLTWAVYPVQGDAYLNFADFELLERDGGVEFYIQYFAQTRTAEADVEKMREDYLRSFEELKEAFKEFCEGSR